MGSIDWRRGAALVSAAVVAVGAAACGSDDDEKGGASGDGKGKELVVGFAAGLTGDAAIADVPARQGMEYAVEELNRAGGVDGHKVRLIVKDMKTDPKLAGVVAKELLDEGASVLLGAPFPNTNVGTIRAGAKQGVPTVLVATTEPSNAVIGGRPAYFTAFGDNQQAAAAAEYARKQGHRTAMTVTSPDAAYTKDTPGWFKESFERQGGEVIGDVTFSIGQQDFGSVVSRIANQDPEPDVIYTSMFVPDTAVFLKELRASGVESAVVGADGFDSPALIEVAGSAADGVAFTAHGLPEEGSKLAEVVEGISNAGEKPESAAFAGLGYDAIQLIRAAVEEAGSIEPEAIDKALAQLSAVEGATGSITLEGTNGIPRKPITIVEVKDGAFAFGDQFEPEQVPEP
jgi:branched-chain amino acid transport system substrate-binding protein